MRLRECRPKKKLPQLLGCLNIFSMCKALCDGWWRVGAYVHAGFWHLSSSDIIERDSFHLGGIRAEGEVFQFALKDEYMGFQERKGGWILGRCQQEEQHGKASGRGRGGGAAEH